MRKPKSTPEQNISMIGIMKSVMKNLPAVVRVANKLAKDTDIKELINEVVKDFAPKKKEQVEKKPVEKKKARRKTKKVQRLNRGKTSLDTEKKQVKVKSPIPIKTSDGRKIYPLVCANCGRKSNTTSIDTARRIYFCKKCIAKK